VAGCFGDRGSVDGGDIDGVQGDIRMAVGEGADAGVRGAGVAGAFVNAEADVQPVRAVAQRQQDIPQRQAVLAAGDGHQHALLAGEHPVVVDEAPGLLLHPGDEVRLAEGQLVLPHVDDGACAAFAAFHERWLPPVGASDRGLPHRTVIRRRSWPQA